MNEETTNKGGSMSKQLYKIVRFYRDEEDEYRNGETIKTGLTLDKAQEHCRRDDTHGEGWFDGYTEDN